MGSLAQVGLALATSIGAWINLACVVWFAARARTCSASMRGCGARCVKFAVAGVVLGDRRFGSCERPVGALVGGWTALRDEMTLLSLLVAIGGVVYGVVDSWRCSAGNGCAALLPTAARRSAPRRRSTDNRASRWIMLPTLPHCNISNLLAAQVP